MIRTPKVKQLCIKMPDDRRLSLQYLDTGDNVEFTASKDFFEDLVELYLKGSGATVEIKETING